MDFMLRYRGLLPSKGSVKDKHQIRKVVNKQLFELCNQEALLAQARAKDLPEGTLKGMQIEVPRPLRSMFFYVPLAGFHFIPIIHRPHKLVCSLDILFLRREKPGAIIQQGGDLDNRLKTLFDALRLPRDLAELKGVTPESVDQRIYCLLEDDSLITKVSVNTHQLLEPLEDEDPSTVELLIHIIVQSTYPMYANLGF